MMIKNLHVGAAMLTLSCIAYNYGNKKRGYAIIEHNLFDTLFQL